MILNRGRSTGLRSTFRKVSEPAKKVIRRVMSLKIKNTLFSDSYLTCSLGIKPESAIRRDIHIQKLFHQYQQIFSGRTGKVVADKVIDALAGMLDKRDDLDAGDLGHEVRRIALFVGVQ